MKTVNVKGVALSALSLGTVQLGLNYGINNTAGKPSQETANAILDCALSKGIRVLDTAASYGDSEAVIGSWLKTVPTDQRPFLCTKAKNLDHSSLQTIRQDLQRTVAQSKARLGVEQLDLLMLHSCDEYLKDPDHVRQVFEELKAAGDVRFTGTSAYSRHDYGAIAESGFDAVQIPLNIFDWIQIDNGGLQKLADAEMMIFVRSVYLQGLVFQKPEELDPRMAFAYDTLVKFRALCARYEMSPAVLALSFALSVPGITSLVLGSETVEQVEQNVALLDQVRILTPEQLAEIHDQFVDTPEMVLSPFMWYNG